MLNNNLKKEKQEYIDIEDDWTHFHQNNTSLDSELTVTNDEFVFCIV